MKRYIKSSKSWEARVPSRYWEPEDDRTDEELYRAYLESDHEDEQEPPFGVDSIQYIEGMTEEDLNYAIENGKPFDLESFNKYKIDPYRAEGAVRAEELKVGDIIQVTEDAAEIDVPSPEIEIIRISYSDPDGYGHDCITFYCSDNETGENFTLHFWPEEWIGPIISRKSDYAMASTKVTSDTDYDEHWDEYSEPDDGPRPGYILWNISWWDQRGHQCGENLEVRKDEKYPGIVIEHYLQDKYGDDYGGIADFMGFDDEGNYITSSTKITANSEPRWSTIERAYSGSEYGWYNYYLDNKYVGRVDSYEYDGDYHYEAIVFPGGDESVEQKLGSTKDFEEAKAMVEIAVDEGISSADACDASDNIYSSINRYSDVRPYEDRTYWYFTTHGVGPGTIPNDLNVLEVREGQNDKGTWGDYICLDGVLNTSELDEYDLRELAPPDSIESAEDLEDEDVDDESWWDEWDPYQGHKYRVYGNDHQANQAFDDPEKAIQCWFKYQKDAPMDVSIMSKTKADAIELVKAATPQLLTGLHAQYKCPYKLDWLISEAEKQVENGCKYFYEDSYGYGDSVHPFGVG